MKSLKSQESDVITRPYEVGNWYRIVTKYIITSSEQPEWGIVSIPSTKTGKLEDGQGWKPRGKIYKIQENDLVMIAGYLFEDQVIILGYQNKFLYTDISELIRINALGTCS
jgi:hypothetical protein